jgi:hypothetical protein
MATATQFTFTEATHTYADVNGIVRPSVSQVIKAEGLISFAGISPSVLERKRQLGSLVHKVTELYDCGEDLNDYDIPDEVWPYFEGYTNFRQDCCFEPRLIEHRVLAQVHGMWYGMTLDRKGQVDGVEHIIELKCGASEHPAWGVQLAAYALGIDPVAKQQPARAAVQLGPHFSRGYKLHSYPDPADYTVWLNSLANAMWKINKRVFSFEVESERMVAA